MFVLVNKEGIPVSGIEEYASETAEETRDKVGRILFMTWDMKSKTEQYKLLMSSLEKMKWQIVQVKRVTPG